MEGRWSRDLLGVGFGRGVVSGWWRGNREGFLEMVASTSVYQKGPWCGGKCQKSVGKVELEGGVKVECEDCA